MAIEFKDRIKNRRLELGMTLDDLAREIGVSAATVSRWESGEIQNLRRDKISILADALRVSPSYLMGWEEDKDTHYEERLSDEAKHLLMEFNSCRNSSLKERVLFILREINRIFNEDRQIRGECDLLRSNIYDREYQIIEVMNYFKVIDKCVSTIDQKAYEVAAIIKQDAFQKIYQNHKDEKCKENYRIIPFLLSGQPVSAGTGAYLGPEEFKTIYVQDSELIKRAAFGIPVKGDSMEPLYHDGDIILVERANEVAIGQVGVFTIDGSGYVKLRGETELISLNPDYEPIQLNGLARCNGKVIGILDPDLIVN